jgi:uncharacterized membrane protein
MRPLFRALRVRVQTRACGVPELPGSRSAVILDDGDPTGRQTPPCDGCVGRRTMGGGDMRARDQHRDERILSPRLAVLALAIGVVAGGLVAVLISVPLSLLVGWIIAAGLTLAWVWRTSWPQDPSGTKRLAEQEGRTRSTDTEVLIAAVASLGAVVLALVNSSSHQDPVAVTLVILSAVAVILSWALVNTVFALKYARLFYIDEDGGLDFGPDEQPTYSDFAYFAFTVGMTYGVTDIVPEVTAVRKAVFGHAVLSYVFGTGILAVAINLVTNLGQQP